MALIDSEGFGFSTNAADYATYGRFTFPNGTSGQYSAPTVTIGTGGPLGDNFLNYNSGDVFGFASGGKVVRAIPELTSQLFFGFRIKPASGIGSTICFVDPSNWPQCCVMITPVGAVVLGQGADGTPLATSAAGVLVPGAWNFLEIGVTIGTTTGAMTVRVNGVTVVSVSAVNTQTGQQGSAGANIGAVMFAGYIGQGTISIAHYYVCDATGAAPCNTFLGDVRVQSLVPVSNDAVAFTPNGLANNWQNAGSVPPVPGSDYNSNGTVGAQDTFNCGTIAPGLGTVYGLNVKSLLSKTDAGPRTAAGVVKSGSTTLAATAVAVSTSPEVVSGIFMTDPNTGAAWSDAAVNAAKIGYKIVS